MKAALYARVSTTDKDQNPEVQLDVLRRYCQDMNWEVYQEYVDQASAADMVGRKQWAELMKAAAVHRFDILLVWKIDRAFRSVITGANTIKMLNSYNVGFRSYSESSIDTTTAYGEFIFNILAAFAELEREQIRERVQAGVDHAKRRGTKSGQPIGRKSYNIPFTTICEALRSADGNYSDAARLLKKKTGVKVSPGFVQIRIQRAGLDKEEVLAGITDKGD